MSNLTSMYTWHSEEVGPDWPLVIRSLIENFLYPISWKHLGIFFMFSIVDLGEVL